MLKKRIIITYKDLYPKKQGLNLKVVWENQNKKNFKKILNYLDKKQVLNLKKYDFENKAGEKDLISLIKNNNFSSMLSAIGVKTPLNLKKEMIPFKFLVKRHL